MKAKTHRTTSVSRIDSVTFECDGAALQYCNGVISVWVDGDTSKEADIDLSVDVLHRIATVGSEQAHHKGDEL